MDSNVKAQAREILNRHLEYTDGLSRGQVMTRTDCALAAVEEALSTRVNTTPDPRSEEKIDWLVKMARQYEAAVRLGDPTLLRHAEKSLDAARAAIAAMGTIASSMGEIDVLLEKHIQRCRDAVSQCPKWSPAQAEWSRARDALLNFRDDLANSQQTEGNGE